MLEEVENNISKTEPFRIRVLTLNLWAVPVIASDVQERIEAICSQILADNDQYHLIFLQEVWRHSYYQTIADRLHDVLPYSHYFTSGVIGSGLCVFSVTPLLSTIYHQFSLNGQPHKILHCDWWGGKGVALCKCVFHGHKFVVATTHLHACYNQEIDTYLHHRVVESFEISQLLDWAVPADHSLILAGDLNTESHEVPFRILQYNGRLKDSFVKVPVKPSDRPGATCGAPGNSYTKLSNLKEAPNGLRIDHILFREAEGLDMGILSCDQPWALRVPSKLFSFSDHEAVRVTFTIRPGSPVNNIPESGMDKDCENLQLRTDALLDASAICYQGFQRIKYEGSVALAICVLALIGLVAFYVANQSKGGFIWPILMLLFGLIGVYALWTAVIWRRIENGALQEAHRAILNILARLREENARYFDRESKRLFEMTRIRLGNQNS